jgi:hypothetical protein
LVGTPGVAGGLLQQILSRHDEVPSPANERHLLIVT